jgi:hypothetical protein
MSVELGKDEMFSSAVAGLPKIAELIATFSSEDRRRALEAAEQSVSKRLEGWATKKQMLSNGRRR